VAVDGQGNVVAPGDVVGQAKQASLNVRTAVKAAGASLSDVAPLLMSRHKRSLGWAVFFARITQIGYNLG